MKPTINKFSFLIMLITLLISNRLFSQSFSTTGGSVAFAATGGTACKNIVVSGMTGFLNHDLGLISVTLNITNTKMEKVSVNVVAPNGTVYEIVNHYASVTYTGANFVNTVITQVNSPSRLNNGTAPFTGSFFPQNYTSSFDFCQINNNARTGNGTWQVCVESDIINGVAGTLNSATLTFGVNAPSEYGTGIAGETPSLAPYKCDISLYSGWTSGCYDETDTTGTNLDAVTPFSIDNNSWIKLMPQSSTMNITFTVKNCKEAGTGSSGLQMVVLEALDAGLTQFREIPTSSGTNPYPNGTYSESVVGLAPGSPIYMMFDGWAGDVCEYDVISYSYSGSSTLMAQSNPASFCSGSGLSSQITTINIPTATYTWTPSTGLSATNIYNPIATPTVSTSYYVTANDPVSGCIFKDTVDIVVNTLPTINAGSDVQICSGSSTTLTATSPGITATGVVEFTNTTDVAIPDNSATGGSSTIAVSNVNPSTYSTARINKVCMNIDHPDIHDLSVQLTSPGGSTISLKNYTTTGVSGYGPDFINACFVVSGGTALSYNSQGPLWTNYAPAGAFTGITSGSAINGNWTLTVKDNYGGNVGTLSDWTMFFNSTPLYNWTPTTNLATPTAVSTTANPTTTTTYNVSVKNGNGCSSGTDDVVVTVVPAPTITGTLTVCVGSTTTLTGSGTPNSVNPWVSASTSKATIDANGVVTGVASGTSVITYTDASGCTKTATVTVNAAPTITGTLTSCVGSTKTLTGTITAAATTPWTSSNTAIATVSGASTSGTVTPVSAGTTTITYTNSVGCSATATFTVTQPTITGTLSACIGGTTQLTGSGTPHATTPWASSSTAVATVNSTGLVTGVSVGTTTLTYKDNSSCTNTASVSIIASNTIALSSAVGTNNQTLCVNNAITTITYTTTGATGATFSGLPTGVSGTWGADVVTISGTPSVAGNYSYTITLTGGCGTVTETGTLTVSALPTPTVTPVTPFCLGGNVVLSGTIGSSATVAKTFSNTTSQAIPDNGVTSAWVGAASASVATSNIAVTGLQTGWTFSSLVLNITHGWDGDVKAYLIDPCGNSIQLINGNGSSGDNFVNTTFSSSAVTVIPTASTNAPFTSSYIPKGGSAAWNTFMTNAQSCGSANGTWILRVADIGASFAGTLNNWTLNFVNNVAPTFTWSPTTNMTGSTTLTPTVTPVTAGTTTYTLTETNYAGCSNTATVDVTALPLPVVPAITGTTTLCAGATTTLANTTAGGTWSSASTSVATIDATTGVVTGVAAGTSIITYSVTSGGCTTSVTTTVTVNALPVVAAITGTTTVCPTLTTTLSDATGGGVWSSASTGVATINSGTGVVTGVAAGTSVINYAVTISGCTTTVSTTVTVNPLNTSVLSSAVGTDGQTVCINSSITPITYATTGATGATFSYPSGLSGSWLNDVATITGTPTVAGSHLYTVTLTGGCGPISSSGTINVTPDNTITLSSAVGTDAQTLCVNNAITTITYTTTGATGGSASGLPTGVSGSWNSGNFVISGTPTITGVFNYTITLTGGCGVVTKTGTITVTPNNTIVLSSAIGTDGQTVCLNTAITNITYTTTGATGATFSGLPAGVSGNWGGDIATISGAPSVSGAFAYTVTLTGGCGIVTIGGTLNVTPDNTITLTSLAGTDAQTLCINSTLTAISYSTTGATNASITGLPLGLSGNFASNTVSITGTPLASGNYPYTITLLGGCGTVTTTGSITVTPDNTITLSSLAGTDGQTVCLNTAITDITYATAGATGATFSGLPTGVLGNWLNDVVTISGIPSASGTFNYTITLTGGCGTITKVGTITITPDNTISLSSGVGTDGQSVCVNSAITNITYATVGATGATFSGLPAGVNGNWAANTVTISGTPNVSGTFNYTITLTGGCGVVTQNGTITVINSNTITLSSLVGTDNQTVCNNSLITPITYTTVGATGATYSGLPIGVSGNWLNDEVTISGTPTVSGVFNYIITLTGGCGTVTQNGTITLTQDNTVTLSSAVGTDNQTKCLNTVITNITYSTVGATGANVTGLPAGVSGIWVGNTVTISGTATVAGTFPYTVTLTGGCGTVSTTGTLTITPDNTITLTSAPNTDAQTVCINNLLTNITYSTTGATGATISGLPTGVTGNWNSDAILITGTPLVAGNYPYTITLTGGCGSNVITGSGTIITGNTINLTSAAGTNAQTLCINTASTSITYATTGATGATITGLPLGMSGSWAANTVTINGTPTVAGSYVYTILLTGGCGVVSTTGTVQVNPDNTILLTSVLGTDAQTVCVNSAIASITYSTTSATGATFSGLPAGVNGVFNSNSVTISGTPTVAGNNSYTITLTGGCGAITATGTMDVTPSNTINLTSAVGTDAQTICVNNPITSIVYSTTGATSVNVVGLPAGVSSNFVGNVLTISGTPTFTGSSSYTINLVGGCGTISKTGTILVNPTNTIALSSAVGTNNQTLCVNDVVTSVTYSTTGATGATFSGLPTGVNGNWLANVVTISGTPSSAGTYNYTVTLTGGCDLITATGTIVVNPANTITLTSAVGSNAQTICIGDAINSITYSTTGATGANFSNLPTGVSGAFSGSAITISGTPSAAGNNSYTITLTGGCTNITENGSININAAPTLTITNPGAVCIPATIDLSDPSVTAGSTGGTILSYWQDATCNSTPLVGETAITTSGTYYIKSMIGSCFSTASVTVAVNDCSCPVSLAITNPAAICAPSTVDLTSTFVETGGGTISYFMPDGSTVLGAPNSVATSGVYWIQTTDISTCFDKKPVTVVINPINTISLTSAVGTDAQTICVNSTITAINYASTNATGATFTGLPTGVTGSFVANSISISGTPSIAGVYNYQVTLTGGCGVITANGTINVNADNTISLSSAIGTDNTQIICESTPITDITYSVTGATGANFTGLPLGVSGNLVGNTVTISGNSSVIGIHNYSVSFTGGCGTINAIGSFEIKSNNTIALSSALNTDNQNVYINNAIINTTYNTVGATGANVTGLPSGVSDNWNSNTLTISGTPTQSGVFNYTVNMSGGCGLITTNGTITVLPSNTVNLTSAVGTDGQTVCVNSPIISITYSTTGYTAATFSNLPSGVTGNFGANTITISGSPLFNGNTTYSIALTGGSGSSTVTGTISVTNSNQIQLTSGIGSDNQTVCVNTTPTSITYSTVGATGATYSNLPTGMSGNWVNDVVTISGTPTVAGTYNYSINLTGGCGVVTANGTIVVSPDNTIALSSAIGTISQTVCELSAITPITYNVTGATGSLVTGLPLGLIANLSGGVLTISGTPTQTGNFNFTVNLTGGCGTPTATGVINVTPTNTYSLTSALGSDVQSICITSPIVDITYNTTGATNATFSNLPAGVTGTWNADAITISGTPSGVGNNTYTILLTGGCGTVIFGGRIDIVSGNTMVLSSVPTTDNPTLCVNSTLTNITYTTAGATGATYSGLPAGVTGNWNANTVTISGTPTTPGTYNYSVTTLGGCGSVVSSGSIIVSPLNTITLTSIVGSDVQTPCINDAISTLTYSTTGATGANFLNFPTGITGSWSNDVITITGMSSVSGDFIDSIVLTGGCGNIVQTGRFDVTPMNSIVLTSAVGTDNSQVVCKNSLINSIVYATTGVNSVTPTGLPAGVTGKWLNDTYTISGAPINAGTYNFTLTLNGGCGNVTTTGTIVVSPSNTINLLSANTTENQTVCIGTPITTITYLTTGATGASFTNLPNGVIGNWSNNVISITGSPNAAANYNFIVTTTGGCSPSLATRNGIIAVNPNNTISLTSALGTDVQTVCQNSTIVDITYQTTGATGATFANLPLGLTSTWSANTVRITGSPSEFGSFNYTVNLTGGCGSNNATGQIDINELNVFTLISATASPAVCENTALTNLVYQTSAATGVTVTGLPNGITQQYQGNTLTISGTPTSAINSPFAYTITATGICPGTDATGSIIVNDVPVISPISVVSPVCEGLPVTLNANANAPVTWDNNVINNVPFFATTTTAYTVTANNGNCSASATVNLVVNPKPMKPGVISNVSYCKGEQNVALLSYIPLPAGVNGMTSVWYDANGAVMPNGAPAQSTINVLTTSYAVAQKNITTGCIGDTAKITVVVKPSVTPLFASADLSICQGKENPVLPLKTINTPIVSGTWTPVSTATPGVVQTTFTPINLNGTCVSDTTIDIEVHPLPVADFIVNPTEIYNTNPVADMINLSTGATHYSWDFGDGEIDDISINPTHTFPDDIFKTFTITLTAISEFNCKSVKTQEITEKEELLYFIPNSFTPNNGDNMNNVFVPVFTSGYSPENFTFTVYSRWGQVVFETSEPNIGWNGKINNVDEDAPIGSYNWRIKFKENESEIIRIKVGTVNLLR